MISLVRKPRTPELNKRAAVLDEANSIGGFLDWLTGEGGGDVHLMRWVRDDTGDDRLVADGRSFEQLLAGYFGIDLDEVNAERMALLDYLRAVNAEVAERERRS